MDKSLNDSGYGEGDEEYVQFIMKLSRNSSPMKIIGRHNETLAHAILQHYPEMKLNNRLFWAKLVAYEGPVCINPFTTPCRFIKPKKEIEWDVYDKTIYHSEVESVPSPPSEGKSKTRFKRFYIDIKDRKYKKGAITFVPHKKLGFCDMCVVANAEQTFKEALIQDGRFVNVDCFSLSSKVEGRQGASISINERPYRFGKSKIIVLVSVKMAAKLKTTDDNRKSEVLSSNVDGASTTEVSTALDGCESMRRNDKKIRNSELAQKMWNQNALYVFTKKMSDLSKEDRDKEMRNCLLAAAWCTLLGPKDRGAGSNYERAILRIAETQFANNHVIPRPVSFSKLMYHRYDAVCFIVCGSASASVTASGFLVSPNMVVTSNHVVDDIEKARNSSSPADHKDVFVYFDYEKSGHGRGPSCSNGHKLLPLRNEKNVLSQDFDYAFLYLESAVSTDECTPLGELVSCDVPERGKVSIVGHPRGEEKQEEMCSILPLHDDRRSLELQKRAEENEQKCLENPHHCACQSGNQDIKCIHLHRDSIQRLRTDTSVVTYDVGSMFEGSSGAPVFDMKGHIVALHTRGYRVGKTSVIEVGVTFRAIIDNLIRNGHQEFVWEHFPICYHQDMEEDEC